MKSSERSPDGADRLEIEHEVSVLTNKLADLINKKDEPMIFAFLAKVISHPTGEIFDRKRELAIGTIYPGCTRLFALAEGFTQRRDNLITMKLIRITLIGPVSTGGLPIGRMKVSQLVLFIQIAF